MTDYRVGQVARIDTKGPDGRVRELGLLAEWDGSRWTAGGCAWHPNAVADVTPLVVLDVEGAYYKGATKHLAELLRENWRDLAAQLEEQTKPARIAQPGPWGVVDATGRNGVRRHFVRTKNGWSDGYSCHSWVDLSDPELVREGLPA